MQIGIIKNYIKIVLVLLCFSTSYSNYEVVQNEHSFVSSFSQLGVKSIKIDFSMIGQDSGFGFGGEYALFVPTNKSKGLFINLFDIRYSLLKIGNENLLLKGQFGLGIVDGLSSGGVLGAMSFKFSSEFVFYKADDIKLSIENVFYNINYDNHGDRNNINDQYLSLNFIYVFNSFDNK